MEAKRKEYKRRNLSGIFIFDQFPGENKKTPTCIEDCTEETREKWCKSKTPEYLQEVVNILMQTYRDVCECMCSCDFITQKQKELLIKKTEEALDIPGVVSEIEKLVYNVNFLSTMITDLADTFDVTKVIH